MTKIFISYRRNDTQEITNRIARVLKNQFGDDNVVLDTDTFLLGNDFRAEIMDHLTSSDVVLVIIGKFWHSNLHDRQVNKPSEIDWVLREIETAISKSKIVTPLMIDGSFIPPKELLPPSIQELANRNGAAISTRLSKFDTDTQYLIQKIQQSTGTFVKPQPNTREYLNYLLLNSDWTSQASENVNEIYLCEQDTNYRIEVDILSDEREDNYTSEWAEQFYGTHCAYPVLVTNNGQLIEKTYFVGVWGGKYFVPRPAIDGTWDKPVYYWDIYSLDLRLARHIARFHTLYKTLEGFAEHGEIELRDD
jgi:hypothetical protein